MERDLVLNAVLIIVTMLALDWRESRWLRRTRREPSSSGSAGRRPRRGPTWPRVESTAAKRTA